VPSLHPQIQEVLKAMAEAKLRPVEEMTPAEAREQMEATEPRYAPLPVRGSVHLSRQFLEKLTDSAIIKVALREDLSGEVATGSRRLAASPRGR
jgi:hypothetical protein